MRFGIPSKQHLHANTAANNTMPPHIPLQGPESDDVLVLQRSESSESALPAEPESPKQAASLSRQRQNGQYTVEEIARHNKKDDAWLIYNNQVLDVSKWVSISCAARCRCLVYSLTNKIFSFTPSSHFTKTTGSPPPRRRTNHPPLRRHGRHR